MSEEIITIYLYVHNYGIKIVHIKECFKVNRLFEIIPAEYKKFGDVSFYTQDMVYIRYSASFAFNRISDGDKIRALRASDACFILKNSKRFYNLIEDLVEKLGKERYHNNKAACSDPAFMREQARLLDIHIAAIAWKPKLYRKLELKFEEHMQAMKSDISQIRTKVPNKKAEKPCEDTIEVLW